MTIIKHIGRIKATGRKVIIAYRTLPGESDAALVIQTENLSEDQHDALIKLVESPAGQSANEFAEVLARANFPDGSIMLSNLHVTGRLTKVKTSEVDVTPNTTVRIGLDELNQQIAEQRGISINDLAIGNGSATTIASIDEVAEPINPNVVAESEVATIPEPAANETPEQTAKRYRSQADRLSKEAANFRRLAEELAPTTKKAAAKQ